MASKLLLSFFCCIFTCTLSAKESNMLDFLKSLEPTMKKINVSLDNNSLEYVSLSYNPTKRNLNYKNLEFKTYGDNKISKKGYVVVRIRNLSDSKQNKIFLFDPKTYILIASANMVNADVPNLKKIPKFSIEDFIDVIYKFNNYLIENKYNKDFGLDAKYLESLGISKDYKNIELMFSYDYSWDWLDSLRFGAIYIFEMDLRTKDFQKVKFYK